MTTSERELSAPVALCDDWGRLSDDARGWSRHPLHTANLRGARGRKKRWDYWCVITDEVVASLVYADVDYAGLVSVWVMEHATGRQATAGTIVPLARGFAMPDVVCTGSVAYQSGDLSLSIVELPDRTVLTATAAHTDLGALHLDVEVDKPAGHESLNVVVPWSDRRFQFTSKHNTRPARGTVSVGRQLFVVDAAHDAWAAQDLGRGIWPYSNRWNWASASGRATDGTLVGLQFGGKWTVGTGATENALCIDGRLSKIGDELEWTYDWDDPMAPWRLRTVTSDQVDVTLHPTFDRYDDTNLRVLRMQVHQCFGTWSGRVVDDAGREFRLDGIRGFAEEARNRW
ncbi:MAG: DUF2804 domain-containing protein [Ilumatobacteraceae bacterium]